MQVYYKVGNEIGQSDPVFMRKYGEELKKDSGKWIDSSVWHGKAHSWGKIPWLIKEVRGIPLFNVTYLPLITFYFSGNESLMVDLSSSRVFKV